MLEDRHYMRRPGFGVPWSATVVLLVVNAVAFILQTAVGRLTDFPTVGYLGLSVFGLWHGFVWQLLTYQFLHGGLLHLLLNCWAIYVFGRAIEAELGWRSFLALYFGSGVAGGLFQVLLGLVAGGDYARPVVGASAGAFGLVAAFATLYPERTLTLLLFFIVPLSLRAKYLLLFSGLLAVFGIVFPGDGIAHGAHLGGMIAGVAFVRYAMRWHWHWPQFPPRRAQPFRPLVKVSRSDQGGWGRRKAVEEDELPPEEFLSREVDPILDKISAHGIQSLTERERRILERAREKMGRR